MSIDTRYTDKLCLSANEVIIVVVELPQTTTDDLRTVTVVRGRRTS